MIPVAQEFYHAVEEITLQFPILIIEILGSNQSTWTRTRMEHGKLSKIIYKQCFREK